MDVITRDLTRLDKLFLLAWLSFIALLLGAIEAQAFVFTDYNKHDFPFYWVIYAFFIICLLSIIPILFTREKTDWLLVTGGSFLMQLFQDWGHWLIRLTVNRDWQLGDPLWTPLWDILGVTFPIPLFWLIDALVFVGLFISWWVFDINRNNSGIDWQIADLL